MHNRSPPSCSELTEFCSNICLHNTLSLFIRAPCQMPVCLSKISHLHCTHHLCVCNWAVEVLLWHATLCMQVRHLQEATACSRAAAAAPKAILAAPVGERQNMHQHTCRAPYLCEQSKAALAGEVHRTVAGAGPSP